MKNFSKMNKLSFMTQCVRKWFCQRSCHHEVVAYFKHRVKPLHVQTMDRQRYLRIYASIPCDNMSINLTNPSAIFAFFSQHLQKLVNKSSKIPIFLQAQSAMRYSQFNNPHNVILILMVPDMALAGHARHLLIKPDHISLNHIHGCLLGWQHQSPYLENPLFDSSLEKSGETQKKFA